MKKRRTWRDLSPLWRQILLKEVHYGSEKELCATSRNCETAQTENRYLGPFCKRKGEIPASHLGEVFSRTIFDVRRTSSEIKVIAKTLNIRKSSDYGHITLQILTVLANIASNFLSQLIINDSQTRKKMQRCHHHIGQSACCLFFPKFLKRCCCTRWLLFSKIKKLYQIIHFDFAKLLLSNIFGVCKHWILADDTAILFRSKCRINSWNTLEIHLIHSMEVGCQTSA